METQCNMKTGLHSIIRVIGQAATNCQRLIRGFLARRPWEMGCWTELGWSLGRGAQCRIFVSFWSNSVSLDSRRSYKRYFTWKVSKIICIERPTAPPGAAPGRVSGRPSAALRGSCAAGWPRWTWSAGARSWRSSGV